MSRKIKRKVLVIDDSLTVRKLAEMILKKGSYKVTSAETAQEGIAAAERDEFDLVLLDYILPDMESHLVCDRLAEASGTKGKQVVLISSRGTDIKRLSDEKENVVDYLTKPFQEKVLLSALDHILRREERGRDDEKEVTVFEKKSESPSDVSANRVAETPSNIGVNWSAKDEGFKNALRESRRLLTNRLSSVARFIPELELRRGECNPKDYYLKYLLAPDLLNDLANRLQIKNLEQSQERPKIAGDANFASLPKVLLYLERNLLKGVLKIRLRQETVFIYVVEGLMGMISSSSAKLYCSGARYDYSRLDRRVIQAGMQRQSENGCPFFVHIHSQEEALDSTHLEGLIHEQGQKALLRTLTHDYGEYAFYELKAMPDFVRQHALGDSISQALLEVLRRVDDWISIESAIGDLNTILDRYLNFEKRVATLYLTSSELDVLALIDGRITVGDVVAKSHNSTYEVFSILFRFVRLQILRPLFDTKMTHAEDDTESIPASASV